jgi:hypothetical protein
LGSLQLGFLVQSFLKSPFGRNINMGGGENRTYNNIYFRDEASLVANDNEYPSIFLNIDAFRSNRLFLLRYGRSKAVGRIATRFTQIRLALSFLLHRK